MMMTTRTLRHLLFSENRWIRRLSEDKKQFIDAEYHVKSMVKSCRDLEIWQKTMDLAEICYRITGKFPDCLFIVIVS